MTTGSSPQARGTLSLCIHRNGHARFIPAGAGNTARIGRKFPVQTVHPRRRGEHRKLTLPIVGSDGSSPQARGTRVLGYVITDYCRFIPAGAGNTACLRSAHAVRTVHPRRRGEHTCCIFFAIFVDGSSPQARGTLITSATYKSGTRFIPAGAGNTPGGSRLRSRTSVHPRRRGEHPRSMVYPLIFIGSSPQARGTHQHVLDYDDADRFIPAGAGNTHGDLRHGGWRTVHPRRRGEHSRRSASRRSAHGSSPQARGTPITNVSPTGSSRFIPAGAGNTSKAPTSKAPSSVHPRRRGEH